ncbi:MAG: DHH family phosphoesterase [Bacteroidetes bacterium HGW-Bacteroidetes-8]|jgi:phosphoesterase RecJ-like protein|nr:MAG: DHH family phosphoesterase [Bacteroidetes bacterium HGW-Bacteroidetes-8]
MNGYINALEAEGFKALIDSSRNILIISHTNPDGDAVGSVVAMRNYLQSKGVFSTIVLPNDYPDYLEFLDDREKILIYKKDPQKIINLADSSDLIIALDFNQLQRVDELEAHILDSGAKRVLIDHHPSPDCDNFNLIISNTDVSSTCELLYWLILTLEEEVSKIDTSVATPLYVGMMTDTNNFSNSVNSATFKMASDILSTGVDKESLQHKVFGGFSQKRMRLMGHILLNKMVIIEKFGAGYITISKEEQKLYDFSEGDAEGFVNLPLNIKEVNISALFTERDGQIRVSLRSVDDFSVNKFSRLHFNGGGHERAAGGKLFINFDEVGSFFERALEQSFQKCKGADGPAEER